MEIIKKKDFLERGNFFIEEMRSGKIFVYPTDTIYGIGCDAENKISVDKIRMIKGRDNKPFSVIVPNKDWIKDNCKVDKKVEKWIEKLPGKYTLILRLFNEKTIGIRIPDNWFSKVVEKFGKPFVTTSVNLSGEKPIGKLKDLRGNIKKCIDYFIEDGALEGSPSTIVNLVEKGKIIKRY